MQKPSFFERIKKESEKMMPKASYKLRLVKYDPKYVLKQLKGGDTVETTETYTLAVNYKGINVKLLLSGNAEDIRENFSNFKFDIKKKTFIQLDLNSKISQKVLDEFADNGIDEEEESEDEEE